MPAETRLTRGLLQPLVLGACIGSAAAACARDERAARSAADGHPAAAGHPAAVDAHSAVGGGVRPDARTGPAAGDSLLLRTPRGIELWATLNREGEDSSGSTCIERALAIREGARRTTVPLLYTRDAPILVNDSTVRVRLWTHCRAGDAYLVNLRSGQPVRARK
jgi:hypothetical protein